MAASLPPNPAAQARVPVSAPIPIHASNSTAPTAAGLLSPTALPLVQPQQVAAPKPLAQPLPQQLAPVASQPVAAPAVVSPPVQVPAAPRPAAKDTFVTLSPTSSNQSGERMFALQLHPQQAVAPPRHREPLSVTATKVLRDWLREHHTRPYPTPEEKTELAKEAQITKRKLDTWFNNARKRYCKGRPVTAGTLHGASPLVDGGVDAVELKPADQTHDAGVPGVPDDSVKS